jgi:hypothetical protein
MDRNQRADRRPDQQQRHDGVRGHRALTEHGRPERPVRWQGDVKVHRSAQPELDNQQHRRPRAVPAQHAQSRRPRRRRLRSIYRKFEITSRAELVLLVGQLTGS